MLDIRAFNQIANAEDACSSGSTLSRWNDGAAAAISRGRPSKTHSTETVQIQPRRKGSFAQPRARGYLPPNSACPKSDSATVRSIWRAPTDRSDQPVREFAAYTAELYRLADWLAECGVENVAKASATSA